MSVVELLLQVDHLPFRPSSVVADRIRALGRTEDLMFSPDQKRLAIAGFSGNKILVIRLSTITEESGTSVLADACVELACPDFAQPHGLSWIDDETLVVANRKKDVIVVPVPPTSDAGATVEVEPLLSLSGGSDGIISTPGSVAVARLSDQYFDFLVCNNYRNYISRHIVRRTNGFEVVSGVRLFEEGLKVPDSIAVSSDGELVAVSNHYGKRVDLFENNSGSDKLSPPVFSLGVPHYPHGVRFAMQDRLILVADAGAPFVHVYARGEGSWKASTGPTASIRVLDDQTFKRGQVNPEEGGPKGLDILADGSLLAVSCEEVPVAFVDFRPVRDQLVGPAAHELVQSRSRDVRMVDTLVATLKSQHAQIGVLEAELRARRNGRLHRRIKRLLKRAKHKVFG